MYTLIFTKDAMYISKRVYADWRDIQEAFVGYKSSLDGFSLEGLIEYMEHDYPDGFVAEGQTWRGILTELSNAGQIDTIRV